MSTDDKKDNERDETEASEAETERDEEAQDDAESAADSDASAAADGSEDGEDAAVQAPRNRAERRQLAKQVKRGQATPDGEVKERDRNKAVVRPKVPPRTVTGKSTANTDEVPPWVKNLGEWLSARRTTVFAAAAAVVLGGVGIAYGVQKRSESRATRAVKVVDAAEIFVAEVRGADAPPDPANAPPRRIRPYTTHADRARAALAAAEQATQGSADLATVPDRANAARRRVVRPRPLRRGEERARRRDGRRPGRARGASARNAGIFARSSQRAARGVASVRRARARRRRVLARPRRRTIRRAFFGARTKTTAPRTCFTDSSSARIVRAPTRRARAPRARWSNRRARCCTKLHQRIRSDAPNRCRRTKVKCCVVCSNNSETACKFALRDRAARSDAAGARARLRVLVARVVVVELRHGAARRSGLTRSATR